MNNKKQSMYEILGVSQTATLEEIKVAHRRQSVRIMSETTDLNREDGEFKLKVLDVALHTLSATALRDAYDAELVAPEAAGNVRVPIKANVVALADTTKALQLLDEIEMTHKAVSAGGNFKAPVQVISSTISTSARSLKTILRGLIGFLVLGSVLSVGKIAFTSRQGTPPSKEVAQAEEKLIILEYYKKYGERPASRAEAEFLEKENKRKENEQRSAEFAEKKSEEEYRRFVDESRRMGENIHQSLARDKAIEEERQRRLEAEKRFQEEAAKEEERIRIENERHRYGIN